MKTAMWGVGLIIFGIFGIVLINIFGNITTTNQQDFTLIRNTVEASMNEAIDRASMRTGFYLCPKIGKYEKDSSNRMVFDSKDDYGIFLNRYGVNVLDSLDSENYNKSDCQLLVGETKLNADVFVESFLRRFANNVNNNKSYKVTIQDIIEYPPKVSVRIDTYNTYNSSGSTTEDFTLGDFNIRNQVDAIFEDKIIE